MEICIELKWNLVLVKIGLLFFNENGIGVFEIIARAKSKVDS